MMKIAILEESKRKLKKFVQQFLDLDKLACLHITQALVLLIFCKCKTHQLFCESSSIQILLKYLFLPSQHASTVGVSIITLVLKRVLQFAAVCCSLEQ
jgi:hypothetical protein